jgi:hypothetical protein
MLDAHGQVLKDIGQHADPSLTSDPPTNRTLSATRHMIVCQICGMKFDVLDDDLVRHHSTEDHLLQSLDGMEKSADARHELQTYAAGFVARFGRSEVH